MKRKHHFLGRDIGVFLLVIFATFSLVSTVRADEDVTISAVVLEEGATTTTGSSGGGSGGTGSYVAPTTITFSGYAYPFSDVFILRDGQEVLTAMADASAGFSATLLNVTPGNYTFSVVAEDSVGIRSTLFTFPIIIVQGTATNISNIFLSPTIRIPKQFFTTSESFSLTGETVPLAMLTINEKPQAKVYTTTADIEGKYSFSFASGSFSLGAHTLESKASLGSQKSAGSALVTFTIGSKIETGPASCLKADLNCDGRINLVDFSILAYWYKKPSPPTKLDLNSDEQITLADFSILAYYWNG